MYDDYSLDDDLFAPVTPRKKKQHDPLMSDFSADDAEEEGYGHVFTGLCRKCDKQHNPLAASAAEAIGDPAVFELLLQVLDNNTSQRIVAPLSADIASLTEERRISSVGTNIIIACFDMLNEMTGGLFAERFKVYTLKSEVYQLTNFIKTIDELLPGNPIAGMSILWKVIEFKRAIFDLKLKNTVAEYVALCERYEIEIDTRLVEEGFYMNEDVNELFQLVAR